MELVATMDILVLMDKQRPLLSQASVFCLVKMMHQNDKADRVKGKATPSKLKNSRASRPNYVPTRNKK